MFNRETKKLALVAALALAAAGVVQAQNDDRLKAFQEAVDGALPQYVDGNQPLVDNLLGAKLSETQLPRAFNFDRVRAALFGNSNVIVDPGCKRTGTSAGEVDTGECIASVGLESGGRTGRGAYQQLSFSKNIGLGNIGYLQRPVAKTANEETDPRTLAVSKDLTDEKAFEIAVALLTKTIGLSPSETAFPPGPPNRHVKSLLLATGGQEPGGPIVKTDAVIIQKVVHLQRGLTLPTPIDTGVVDRTTGEKIFLTKVRAPGQAWVALGGEGSIVAFDIFNWQDLRPNDKSLRAKSRAELVDEIARELVSLGENPPAVLKILIGLSAESKGTYGLLLPAVQVYSLPSTMPKDPDEKTQEAFAGQATTGSVFEVSLAHSEEKSEER